MIKIVRTAEGSIEFELVVVVVFVFPVTVALTDAAAISLLVATRL